MAAMLRIEESGKSKVVELTGEGSTQTLATTGSHVLDLWGNKLGGTGHSRHLGHRSRFGAGTKTNKIFNTPCSTVLLQSGGKLMDLERKIGRVPMVVSDCSNSQLRHQINLHWAAYHLWWLRDRISTIQPIIFQLGSVNERNIG